MILEVFVYTRLRYRELAAKKFVTLDLNFLSNRKSVCKWNWLMKQHYIAHSIAYFEGPTTNALRFSGHFARSRTPLKRIYPFTAVKGLNITENIASIFTRTLV